VQVVVQGVARQASRRSGRRKWQGQVVCPEYLAFQSSSRSNTTTSSPSSSPLLPAALATVAVAVAAARTSTGRTFVTSASPLRSNSPPELSPGPYLIEIDAPQHEELHSRSCFCSCSHRVCPGESQVVSIRRCQASQRRSHAPLFPRDAG
jgi:hypothetical protein